MKKIPTATSKHPVRDSSITVRLSEDLKTWIQKSAKALDLNAGQFVRRAVSTLREQEEGAK